MKKKNHKTNKIRTFLLFLFLACIIWVLTKFSKEYTATITGKLNYVSLPANSVLSDGNVSTISIDITANGFEFLMFQLKAPEIEIPVSKYYSHDNKKATIDINELSRIVSTELAKAITAKDLSISQLNVNLDEVASMKIPVATKTRITFKDGFKQVNGISIQPDSITVVGPKNLLESLAFIYTTEIVANQLDKTFQTSAKLDKPKNVKVSLDPQTVDVTIDVVEYTQKSLVIPIEIINKPSNSTVKIIPETLTLTFDISVTDFNSISNKDFQAICDFAKKNTDENYMLVEIVRQPEGIFNLEYPDKKIDYLIFK